MKIINLSLLKRRNIKLNTGEYILWKYSLNNTEEQKMNKRKSMLFPKCLGDYV